MADHMPHKEYNSKHAPTWCPGCGNFAIWIALKKALARLHIPAHKVLIVYGVGCSGNMANTLGTYGFHGLHGRAVPVAVGAKLANKDSTVIIAGGDGDGYGEGLSHFIHAIRGNVDVTYLVHNNNIYGLTTGQSSPTSRKGFKSKSTPAGLIEVPINPIALALAADASFVARGFAGRLDELVDLMVAAIKHEGFSFMDIFQPCVTFNKLDTYTSYYGSVYALAESAGYDSRNKTAALAKALESGKLPLGIFYQDTTRPQYQAELSYLKGSLLRTRSDSRDITQLMREFI